MSDDEIEIEKEGPLGKDLTKLLDDLDGPLRNPSNTIPGKMEIIMRKFSRLIFKLMPKVQELDPDGTSEIVAALRRRVRDLFDRYQAWCSADNFPDDVPQYDDRSMPEHWLDRTKWSAEHVDPAERAKEEADRAAAGYLSIETERRLDWFLGFVIEVPLDSTIECAHTIIGTHETMGLTPHDIEHLMARYEVESLNNGLIEWETIDQIKEMAFMSRLRSDSALKRRPSVTDGQIKMVVSSCEGQKAQARILGISVRQLQRRLKRINDKV